MLLSSLSSLSLPTPHSSSSSFHFPMEHSWENWTLIHTEMGHPDDGDFLEQCHTEDDDFLRDILQQPEFSSESETQSFHHHPPAPTAPPPPPIVHNNNNNNSTASLAATDGSSSISSDETDRPAGRSKPHHRPSSSNSPRTFILSFDNSTIIPATPEQPYLALGGTTTPSSKPKSTSSPALSSKKRALDDSSNTTTNNNHQNLEAKPSRATSQGGKKSRNYSQTMDHILAERKRRQELTERFIALSATIPGLKKILLDKRFTDTERNQSIFRCKALILCIRIEIQSYIETDKASILGEAVKYVKQLKERVTELEKRNKQQRGAAGDEAAATMILVKKQSDEIRELDAKEDGMMMISSSETSSGGDDSAQAPLLLQLLPDVEARVVEKEVVVEIHCQKAKGIELKLLEHLENDLHLTVTGSSVLPFANSSTLGITIIAQMGEGYRMTVNDVVRNLREVLVNEAATSTSTTY